MHYETRRNYITIKFQCTGCIPSCTSSCRTYCFYFHSSFNGITCQFYFKRSCFKIWIRDNDLGNFYITVELYCSRLWKICNVSFSRNRCRSSSCSIYCCGPVCKCTPFIIWIVVNIFCPAYPITCGTPPHLHNKK